MRTLIASGYMVSIAAVRRSDPGACAHDLVGRRKYDRVPGWQGMGDCRLCGSTVTDPAFSAGGAPMSISHTEGVCAAR